MDPPTDCLVLYIRDNFTEVYVFYDSREGKYILRGKPKEAEEDAGIPWNFSCQFRKVTEEFIRHVLID